MTRDVLISVRGMQQGDSTESEEIETIAKGIYEWDGNKHRVTYEELMDGFDEPCVNSIDFCTGKAFLQKSGAVRAEMNFEEARKSLAEYQTPYGDLILGIIGNRIDVKESENEIKVEIEYELEANGQHLADSAIALTIKPVAQGMDLF